MRALMVFSIYFLFLIPKINLISVGGFNAGLRIDDAIIAMWMLVFLLIVVEKKITFTRKIDFTYYMFLMNMLIGTTLSSVIYQQGTIIFPFRFLEYFTFFIMGVYIARKEINISTLMQSVFYMNVIVALLQFSGVLGGFSVTGYRPNVSARVIGLTSGPWELGVILNFITCYLFASSARAYYKYFVFVLGLLVILLSGSRMSFVAQVVLLIVYMFNHANAVSIIRRILIVTPFVFLTLIYFSDSVVAERSEKLFNVDNLTSLPDYYRNTELVSGNPDWTTSGMLEGNDVDASWAIRSIKWMYALKLFLSNPMFIFFGVGAGTFGIALDGGWLRLFTECGVVGALLFISFFRRCKRSSRMIQYCFIVFSINMIMIDVYMSYKIMAMLLFLAGYMTTINRLGLPFPEPKRLKIRKDQ
ncbi:O-antigen ligase family protein [Serratia rhizosphaerae]|uniref:Lipid A core - O-antigen ligase and related enzymes n=1 Tax=Serratia rhizosphaerae TaxID=2597702 RepID=A0ABX6GR57_9GAMM|nr:O-antigen ligase family protein [Serratia rhizosphaerae]MEB6335365.1 O-antigen ligase family protein [Serratia rhizosphaerae]QHA88763.1 hypothetical protein FO014_18270 [Serratia rhizosphaerae]